MIERLVYTYCTFDGTTYLNNFPTIDSFVRVFSESIYESKKIFKEVVCYTDVEGQLKLKELGIDIDTIIVDFLAYNFDRRFWNFPKLITYNMQDKPFVHIDTDFIIYSFDKDSDVITERMRPCYIQRSYFRFLKELNDHYTPQLICSGCFGGSNLKIFKELFTISSEIVRKENWKFIQVHFNSLIAIEEIVTTCLVNKYKLKVECLNENTFLHYQGPNKLNLR